MRLGILKGVVTALTLSMLAAGCGDEEEEEPEPPASGMMEPPVEEPPVEEPPVEEPPVEEPPVESPMTIVEVAAENEDLSMLAQLVTDQGLADTLGGEGPFTVFAPTNAAFENLVAGSDLNGLDDLTDEQLTAILQYHVIASAEITSDMIADGATQDSFATSGEGDDATALPISFDVSDAGIFVNGLTEVTTADVDASNGVVHVIDTVLLPPGTAFPGTTVQAASYYTGLSTLVTALDAAALTDSVGADNSYTVFAPTNSGFAAVEDLQTILDDQATLTSILTYHVLPPQDGATLSAADIVAAIGASESGEAAFGTVMMGPEVVATVNGEGGVQINDTNVIFTDLVTSNGRIHVIDGVLTPPPSEESP